MARERSVETQFQIKMEDIVPHEISTSLENLMKDLQTARTAMNKQTRKNNLSKEELLAWTKTEEMVQRDLFSFCKGIENVKKARERERFLSVSGQQFKDFSELESRCHALVAKGEALCKGGLDSTGLPS